MEQMRYPVGVQTFSKIIEEGLTYVDKTAFIKPLLSQGQFIFLSRPRRFGKSLLLSTLKAYFEGRRELFKGLAADRMDLDWTPSPTLCFDFNSENFKLENGLQLHLDTLLRSHERTYGRQPEDISPSQRFRHLIESAYLKTGRRVVILIDEYDKPLLDLEDNEALFEKNQNILKSFFGNLKSMDEYIRFAFITGVARFSKVSIFSDLNNLEDISIVDEFQEICGWTEKELVKHFSYGINSLSAELNEDFESTVGMLRDYYDGYLFSKKGNRLYNPFSVLKALKDRDIKPYWHETGTPTFLAKKIKKYDIDPDSLNGQKQTYSSLTAGDNIVGLMFRTGYLTIKSYDPRRHRYTLGFPNYETEVGLAQIIGANFNEEKEARGLEYEIEKLK